MKPPFPADIVEPLRSLQEERTNDARHIYQQRKREIEASALSMEERLDARREALREMRSAITAAYRELKPQPFGTWLQEREDRRERSHPTTQRQERSVEREQSRDQSFLRAEEVAKTEHLDLGR